MRSSFSKTNGTEPTTEHVTVSASTASQSTVANNSSISKNHDDIDHGWAWVVMMSSFCCFVLCAGAIYTSGIVHSVLLNRYNAKVSVTTWASGPYSALILMSGKKIISVIIWQLF